MNKVLIIIPVFNEEENIEEVINEIRRDVRDPEILVIDDCSTDDTLSIVRRLDVHYVSLHCNVGYAGALQCGFQYALENTYEYVIQYDGDGQHVAVETKKLYDCITRNDADIVIGSRFIHKTDYKHPPARRFGTFIFKSLIRLLTKYMITDSTSGFQILNRSVFTEYAEMDKFPEYPDANLLIEMSLRKFKIIEVPVHMRDRVYGKGMHGSIISSFMYMRKLLHAISITVIHYLFFTHRHR